ncbi:MAG: hypothetical protein OSJ27_00235 [Candidatus Gastranaerophilales bacterium]|nr:hypothetical protein [Candidatus Gastranaerophilales bacterium]
MKKILAYCLIFLLAQSIAADAVLASTFGTYRQEYEYGLFDGIKFNILNRKKDEKIIDIKDDVDKKVEKTVESKEAQDKKDDDEYQMYKFMLDDTIAF